MSVPRVSVIVALFNSARFLPACLESLRKQTFTDFEVLMVDGGSSDETPAIARRFEQRDPRFRFLPAEGFKLISEARADALEECRGAYVAVLDSDDRALPERLERQTQWLDAHSDCVLLTTDYRVINARGWTIRWSGMPLAYDADMRWRLTFGNCLTQSTLMMRREALIKAGGYDRAVKAGEDMDLYVRLLKQGRFDMLPECLSVWRWHPSSLSKTEPVEYKDDFPRTLQKSIRLHLGQEASLSVAAALLTPSRQPAANAVVLKEALRLISHAFALYEGPLQRPRERRALARAAFFQLVDLYSRNRHQPWWPEAVPTWAETLRGLSRSPGRYRWYNDLGLFAHYRKLLKFDWGFLLALRRAAPARENSLV
jgi:glycosyltransferase involved in cell wall biosynthesis